MNKHGMICQRVKKFGYSSERRIRLHGEALQLISNPVADGTGYSVLAVTVGSGNLRHLRISLSVLSGLQREELVQLAA